MKNIWYILLVTLIFCQLTHCQVINNGGQSQTRGTFEVRSSGSNNWYDGIIFPKIPSLTTSNDIIPGMITFFNSSQVNQAGLYYYNENSWKPFYSSNLMVKDNSTAVFRVENIFKEINNNTTFIVTKGTSNNRNFRLQLKTGQNDIIVNHPTVTPDDPNPNIFTVSSDGNLKFPKVGQYIIIANIVFEITSESDQEDQPEFRNGIEIYLYKKGSPNVKLNIGSGASMSNFYERYEESVLRKTKLNVSFAGRINIPAGDVNSEYILQCTFKKFEAFNSNLITEYTLIPLTDDSSITIIKTKDL